MPRGRYRSALFVIAVAVIGTIYTAVAGNQPLLGLDLQGGVSVVLQPTGEVEEEALDQSVEIIRARVDALGVAEPEISRQGDTIVVDLPGVEEQQRALALVGQTAELRFRPVILDLGPIDTAADPEGEAPADDADAGTADDADADAADTGSDDADADAGTDDADADADAGTDEESMVSIGGRLSPVVPAQDDDTTTEDGTTTTTADADEDEDSDGTTTTADPDEDSEDDSDGAGATTSTTLTPEQEAAAAEQAAAQQALLEACLQDPTEPEDDASDEVVRLFDRNGSLLCLGPTLLTGEALETADVSLDQTSQWTVNPVFKSGAEGIDAFNDAALLCYSAGPDPEICPSGRLAIVLDHEVVSAPSINAAEFARDQIVISGAFVEDEARDLASVLKFGALPVELETQQTRTVSATIGDDVLVAGVISGLIGLLLVSIYLLAYYRLAGLVALVGLVLSFMMLWTIVAWFGEEMGLALTLAGVVGLIVSIGVAADSNIVYFENVKDTYLGGRKIATSVERAYKTSISTIVKADVVSLIAAGLLYWLTVGAVRGFAFYLGLATLLDLFIAWLFMRPALLFLARREAVTRNPALLGLPRGGASS